ncbi:MAG: FAD:protein FMN transferase [Spirochaetaceae bacterium]|jgi:thiamine biosynthesis lipoprotein|nr:FAD:protein FMN transferase [Spirochaetaceae bacterium]
MKNSSLFTVFLIIPVFLAGCRNQEDWQYRFLLGTICRVKFFDRAPKSLANDVFSRIAVLEDILSANKEDTDLDMVNKNAGIGPVKVRKELIDVSLRALYYAEISEDENGCAVFDPTIGPLVKLWNIGSPLEQVPLETDVKDALSYVNWRAMEVDSKDQTIFLTKKNMSVDLGAIAKGYAADEAVKIIKNAGVKSAILDLGGNIYVLGRKPDGLPFKIGVQDPKSSRRTYIGVVSVSNMAVITSGDYERFFEKAGIRYHHILSTKTGHPVWNNLRSVTIVSENSMDADALSTMAFVMGFEKGSALIDSIAGTGGIFVFNDNRVTVSESLKGIFSLNHEKNIQR